MWQEYSVLIYIIDKFYNLITYYLKSSLKLSKVNVKMEQYNISFQFDETLDIYMELESTNINTNIPV